MYKFALILTIAFLGASGKNIARNDDNDHDFTEQDVKNVINLVFCSCDNDGDFQLTLDEYLGPVCEAVGLYMFDHENDEGDFTFADADGNGILTVEEVVAVTLSEITSERIATALRGAALRDFSKGDAIEAGVRVLGCACDTDFTYTVNLDEANAEQCIGVQEWMTIGHDGQDFLENTIHMVFCACDSNEEFDLTLDEYLSPVCEAVGFFMFHHENSEDDFTMIDFNEDGILSPGEVFYAAMNADEMLTGRSIAALRQSFNKDEAIEAGVRVLGCACDTDGSLTVSIDEANAEECIHVQHSMTETDEDPEGHEFS